MTARIRVRYNLRRRLTPNDMNSIIVIPSNPEYATVLHKANQLEMSTKYRSAQKCTPLTPQIVCKSLLRETVPPNSTVNVAMDSQRMQFSVKCVICTEWHFAAKISAEITP